MGAADHDAGAALGAEHIHHIDLDGLAFGVYLAGHLLVVGQDGLAALAQFQNDHALFLIHAGHGGLHQIVGAGLDIAQLLAALCLTDALTDDVLCGLGGNAAEVLGLERGDDVVAHQIIGAELLRFGHADLGILVVPVLIGHDVLDQGHVKPAGGGINVHADVLIVHIVILLHGDDDGCLDLLDQVFCGDIALLFQHGQSVEKVHIIVRIFGTFLSCHFPGSSCNLLSINGVSFLNRTDLRHRTAGRWTLRSPQRTRSRFRSPASPWCLRARPGCRPAPARRLHWGG